MSKIEFQKDLANKILNDLKIIGSPGLSCCGASRDWNFGEEAELKYLKNQGVNNMQILYGKSSTG